MGCPSHGEGNDKMSTKVDKRRGLAALSQRRAYVVN